MKRRAVGVAAVAVVAALAAVVLVVAAPASAGEVTQLNDQTFDQFLDAHEVVLVNFYADWCRFSQMLKPIYDQAAKLLTDDLDAALGRVDCEAKDAVSVKTSQQITKYPTIKVYRHGKELKQEYRGQRSPTAIEAFIRDLLSPPLREITSDSEVAELVQRFHKVVSAQFPAERGPDTERFFTHYRAIADSLRDECHFTIQQSDSFKTPTISFQSNAETQEYKGTHGDIHGLLTWTKDVCQPLVREITFQNGEQLTEEGLPFIILFYNPDDLHPVEQFQRVVKHHLEDYRGKLNFITANGHKFTHPLQHLGKTKADLPILAADTFRHMYLFKNYKRMHNINVFKKFIDDVLSGTLHRNIHMGIKPNDGDDPYADAYNNYEDEEDDEVETIREKLEDAKGLKHESKRAAEAVKTAEKIDQLVENDRVRRSAEAGDVGKASALEEGDDEDHRPVVVSSVMKKLKPSSNRYTFARNREEL